MGIRFCRGWTVDPVGCLEEQCAYYVGIVVGALAAPPPNNGAAKSPLASRRRSDDLAAPVRFTGGLMHTVFCRKSKAVIFVGAGIIVRGHMLAKHVKFPLVVCLVLGMSFTK